MEMPKMAKLKAAAQVSGVTPYRLRLLCAANEVAHIRAGNRLIVNLDDLARYLNGSGRNTDGEG